MAFNFFFKAHFVGFGGNLELVGQKILGRGVPFQLENVDLLGVVGVVERVRVVGVVEAQFLDLGIFDRIAA